MQESDSSPPGSDRPPEMSPGMEPEAFRAAGHELVDWIADYLTSVEDYPVLSRARPGEVREALPEQPPEQGEAFADVLADVERIILPGITHWQSPNFFAFFPANASGPGILGEMLSAGLGVQGMLWATSPACTELETHVLDWLARALDLPEGFRSDSEGGGVIQDTASSATLCALLAARERISEGRANREGAPVDLVVYASAEAHSSLDKAARIAGIGDQRVRKVPVDAEGRMEPTALERILAEDRAAGLRPGFLMATLGTTSTLAFDPLESLGRLAAEHDLWLHVDAAMAGNAAICPEYRWMHAGLEQADSYCVNPHKWLFTNFDCDCFWVRDRRALTRALGILPEYLRNPATESGEVIDYRDWQIPLGRRFRSLKLWFVLRHYGLAGLRARLREHCRLAGWFAGQVDGEPCLKRVAPVHMNLVCFRHRDGDEAGQELLRRLNDSGRLYLSSTRVDGHFVLRMSIGQTGTTERHVRAAWKRIRAEARDLLS